jgi:tRNA pseudouridine55 synthase
MPRRRRADPAGRCDGVLLLDKPLGVSSNAALQRVRRALGAARAGHAGTLDPLATGLLVVCLGEATKFAQWPTDADKTYEAEIELGVTTETGDAEGAVLVRRAVDCGPDGLASAMGTLTGCIEQVPPMYSALKRAGRPYYAYARAGEALDREPRTVTIREFRLLSLALPRLRARVVCSKGTYVRVLAEQLGERLGCGAHLSGLRRTAVGRFDVADAVELAVLESMPDADRHARLLPVEVLVAGLPRAVVDVVGARRMLHGLAACPVSLEAPAPAAGSPIAVFAAERGFLGLAEWSDEGVRPRRLVVHGGGGDREEIAGSADATL